MRLLSMALPLRTTIAWGEFLNVQFIPWVYGRCSVTAIPYNAGQTQWCVADHVIGGVDAVTVGGETAAFVARNVADSSGHAIALIELPTAPKDGKPVAATVRGALHPVNGTLLENPAEVVWDVLRRSEIAVNELILREFYRQCAAAGLTVGGSLATHQTLRGALDEVLSSIGAEWSGGARGWARLWPSN